MGQQEAMDAISKHPEIWWFSAEKLLEIDPSQSYKCLSRALKRMFDGGDLERRWSYEPKKHLEYRLKR